MVASDVALTIFVRRITVAGRCTTTLTRLLH